MENKRAKAQENNELGLSFFQDQTIGIIFSN